MRLVARGVTFSFGVGAAGEDGLPVTGVNVATVTTTAPPAEPDSLQLRAAERLGLFPYADTAHRDSVKGHAA